MNEFFDSHKGAPTVDAQWDVKVEVFQGLKVQIRELKLMSVAIESTHGLNALKDPHKPVEKIANITHESDIEMMDEEKKVKNVETASKEPIGEQI